MQDPEIDLTPEEYPLGTFLMVMRNRHLDLIRERCEQLGLKPPHGPMLMLIDKHPERIQKAYARALGIDLATFGRHVEALVKLGLITKRRDDADQRATRLAVTDAGRTVLEEVRVSEQRDDEAVLSRLSNKDAQALKQLAARYADAQLKALSEPQAKT